MTGWMAYLYDPDGRRPLMNMETLVTCPVSDGSLGPVEELDRAASGGDRQSQGADILQHWDLKRATFRTDLPERDAGALAASAWR